MRKQTKTMRFCNYCGRPLEIGESCNCQQPIRGSTRDGLRAICPQFRHRSSYRGVSYIVCGNSKSSYPTSGHRNEHYRLYCCGLFKMCEIYKTMKGETDTCKAQK